MARVQQRAEATAESLDAVVVGAGFAGLYMLHRLRGLGLRVRVFETGSGVGGTWYWNRYPGARCDIESMEYSYQFSEELQQGWEWTERYATQPEILRYINHVADRFDLRRDIQFETRVTDAVYDQASNRWMVATDKGEHLSARFCIMAIGCLSTPRRPNFEGLESFRGDWYHTGYWPHDGVDFGGKRVGVIGTGSSAIQAIPIIARQAAQLTVFQRTANFSIPAWDGPLDAATVRDQKSRYPEIRAKARASIAGDIYDSHEKSALEVSPEERRREFERRWKDGAFNFQATFPDLLTSEAANDLAA
ncbi:MAG: NAD(P)/FAD-dependent oxidoreductase, partial [Planctomycetota bacterium]|nr:NAD(P)/FAD-dependent oxidoreductase [Planctomycetota bacterium]